MNENVSPIYPRLLLAVGGDLRYCCGEQMFTCPEENCGALVCCFCADSCECGAPLF